MASLLSQIKRDVDWDDSNLWLAVFFTVWTPLMWNVLCQYEYRNHTFTKFFGSPHLACKLLSLVQIASSQARNHYFMKTVEGQATWGPTAYDLYILRAGQTCTVIGFVLVVTSFYGLGWTGTWHGDHFGILLSAKVVSFPFNIVEHPMYTGATLAFIGLSLGRSSTVGIILTLVVHVVYFFTQRWEGPFTDMIYAKAAARNAKNKSK